MRLNMDDVKAGGDGEDETGSVLSCWMLEFERVVDAEREDDVTETLRVDA